MMSQIQFPNVAFIESATILKICGVSRLREPSLRQKKKRMLMKKRQRNWDMWTHMLSTDLPNVGSYTKLTHPTFTRINLVINLSYTHCKHDDIWDLNLLFLSSANIGISHPDIVVETNTLSSVPPPDITYTLSIPETTIACGLLSALQLEAIIYACQVLITTVYKKSLLVLHLCLC